MFIGLLKLDSNSRLPILQLYNPNVLQSEILFLPIFGSHKSQRKRFKFNNQRLQESVHYFTHTYV